MTVSLELLTESLLGSEAAQLVTESFSQSEVVTRGGPGESDEQGIVEVIGQSEVCDPVGWKHVLLLDRT